jgi:hypothetical protein
MGLRLGYTNANDGGRVASIPLFNLEFIVIFL